MFSAEKPAAKITTKPSEKSNVKPKPAKDQIQQLASYIQNARSLLLTTHKTCDGMA